MNSDMQMSESENKQPAIDRGVEVTTGSDNTDKYLERFRALQRRREEASRGSTARRISDLKASLVDNIRESFRNDDELNTLKIHGVDVNELSDATELERNKRKRKHCKDSKRTDSASKLISLSAENSDCKTPGHDKTKLLQSTSNSLSNSVKRLNKCEDGEILGKVSSTCSGNSLARDSSTTSLAASASTISQSTSLMKITTTTTSSTATASSSSSSSSVRWQDIKPYLTINDHLVTSTGSGVTARSRLEKKLEHAIDKKDFTAAERLSDELATREFGVRIATAIDAKSFIEKRKAEEDAKKAARKKKLAWGFVSKHRWETKGNM